MCVCSCVYVCVAVCVHVKEKDRQREMCVQSWTHLQFLIRKQRGGGEFKPVDPHYMITKLQSFFHTDEVNVISKQIKTQSNLVKSFFLFDPKLHHQRFPPVNTNLSYQVKKY